ncbi:MAG: cyclase family protein [Thermoleophilia bacterium]|nr:cyclase family protein [Thermoleophilia bacterium]
MSQVRLSGWSVSWAMTSLEGHMTTGDSTRAFTTVGREGEVGPAGDLSRTDVLTALRSVTQGRIYDLEVERFRGMPIHPAHPQMEVVSFRTPRGIRNQGDQEWLKTRNSANMSFISELVMGTVHSGTHIDAFAHVTVGEDNHWHGGFSADDHLGDWGPLKGDASALPPIITRGVLIDVAGHKGVKVLEGSEGISSGDLKDALAAQSTELRPRDAVLIRTGYCSLYPDGERMKPYFGSGINADAARWLADQGAVVVGGDTESLEQLPSADPENPHIVHTVLLIEHGIHIVEMVYLEDLAADKQYEFLFIACGLKIRGATGSMIRPIAVV